MWHCRQHGVSHDSWNYEIIEILYKNTSMTLYQENDCTQHLTYKPLMYSCMCTWVCCLCDVMQFCGRVQFENGPIWFYIPLGSIPGMYFPMLYKHKWENTKRALLGRVLYRLIVDPCYTLSSIPQGYHAGTGTFTRNIMIMRWPGVVREQAIIRINVDPNDWSLITPLW